MSTATFTPAISPLWRAFVAKAADMTTEAPIEIV